MDAIQVFFFVFWGYRGAIYMKFQESKNMTKKLFSISVLKS